MKSNFLIALTLLLLGTSVAYGEIVKSKITTDSFATAPVAVIDPAKDTLFANVFAIPTFFSAGKSSDTLYAWSMTFDNTSNTTTSLIKKSIDASTLAEKAAAVSIKIAIQSKIPMVGHVGPGFIGLASLRDSGSGTADNLFFNVLAADADNTTLPTEVKLTDNSDATVSYYLDSVFFQDGYFYILYLQFDTAKGDEKGLYLQAVKGADASLLFKDAVKIADLNNPPASTVALAGANKVSGADTILVVYKDIDKKSLMQKTVTISNGKVDEATTLVTDSNETIYLPAGIITASSVYGLIVDKQTGKGKDIVDDLKLYLNGATSKPLELDLEDPANYNNPIIKAFDNKAGFALIAQYAGENDFQYVLKIFGSDGTAQGDAKTLINTQANMNFFADADGAIWVGYADFNSDDGFLSTAYLGKVLA